MLGTDNQSTYDNVNLADARRTCACLPRRILVGSHHLNVCSPYCNGLSSDLPRNTNVSMTYGSRTVSRAINWPAAHLSSLLVCQGEPAQEHPGLLYIL